MTWFVEAEQEPMPEMLVDMDWQAVKNFFRDEASGLI